MSYDQNKGKPQTPGTGTTQTGYDKSKTGFGSTTEKGSKTPGQQSGQQRHPTERK